MIIKHIIREVDCSCLVVAVVYDPVDGPGLTLYKILDTLVVNANMQFVTFIFSRPKRANLNNVTNCCLVFIFALNMNSNNHTRQLTISFIGELYLFSHPT